MGVWCLLTLLLTTGVASALDDPFFDRVSGNWQHPHLEGEAESRPVWRIPGTIETLSFTPVLLLVASVTPTDSPPARRLPARPPFVPPRS
jgi:hypothetical protein